MLPQLRERGYKPGRFSFNLKEGRCEACQGGGLKRIGNFTGSWACRRKSFGRASAGFRLRQAADSD
jgi:hypothetical protein